MKTINELKIGDTVYRYRKSENDIIVKEYNVSNIDEFEEYFNIKIICDNDSFSFIIDKNEAKLSRFLNWSNDYIVSDKEAVKTMLEFEISIHDDYILNLNKIIDSICGQEQTN